MRLRAAATLAPSPWLELLPGLSRGHKPGLWGRVCGFPANRGQDQGLRKTKAALRERSGGEACLPEPEMKPKKTRFCLGIVQGPAVCQQPGQLGRAP